MKKIIIKLIDDIINEVDTKDVSTIKEMKLCGNCKNFNKCNVSTNMIANYCKEFEEKEGKE